jgi:hypothetical protein
MDFHLAHLVGLDQILDLDHRFFRHDSLPLSLTQFRFEARRPASFDPRSAPLQGL